MPGFSETGLNFISLAHRRVTTFNYQQIDGSIMTERPLGVTILGILWILGGLLALLGGLGIAAIGSMIAGPFGLAIGIVFIIIGLVDLALGIGCFKAWPWVWTVGVVFSILSIIMGLYSLVTTGLAAVIGLIIPVIILYYLFQPNVKAYFGKT
jgi:hypothetical protein